MIRVLVIDDHSKVHMGITALLETVDDMELVGHGNNGQQAIQLCEEMQPDIVLMDVIMVGMNGIEATHSIHQQFPEIKILALSHFQDQEAVRAMLDAGAIGYILKSASINDLVNTIRVAYGGNVVFSPEIAKGLLHDASVQKSTPDYGLTPREFEILKLLVEGLSNNEIAATLTISNSTVKFHVGSIFSKLGVSNRVEAVTLTLENKLLG